MSSMNKYFLSFCSRRARGKHKALKNEVARVLKITQVRVSFGLDVIYVYSTLIIFLKNWVSYPLLIHSFGYCRC